MPTFLSSCFPAGQAPAHTGAWGGSSPVQDLALPLVKLHKVPVSPFLQPDKALTLDNLY